MGLSPTGLHVARTINRLGVRVIGVGRPGEVGLSSRAVSRKILDDGKMNALDLVEAATGGQKAILLPTSDEYVELISKDPRPNLDFQPSYRSSVADLLLTKADFYQKCADLGLRYPRSVVLDAKKTRSQLQALDLPAIFKPSRMHEHKAMMRGKKGWIVNDAADLDRQWPDIAAFPGEIIAQEFIPGPESEIRLVCGTMRAGGMASSLFTARKLRQYPRGIGSASVVQSAEEPDAAEMAVTFLRSIGYEGIFGAELKRHTKTGELYFIEINPRTSLWFSVSEASGCPVVQQSYLDLAQPDCAPLRHKQIQGIRWRYWLKDTATQTGYFLRPKPVFPLPKMTDAGPVTSKVWAVFESGDARPAMTEPFNLARKLVRRLAGAK